MRLSLVPLCLIAGLMPVDAFAYHPLPDFESPAIESGGGRMYFTGSPRWRGYTCGICHVGAAERIRFEVTSQPPELMSAGAWTPGAAYDITVTLVGEHREKGAEKNRNSFVLGFETDAGTPVGTYRDPQGGLQAKDHGPNVADGVVAASADGRDRWSFEWTAPPRGSGRITLWFGGVDGDAASGWPEPRPPTDPYGDDVFAAAWRLCEQGSACDKSLPGRPDSKADASPASCSAFPGGGAASGLALVALALLFLRRRAVLLALLVLVSCHDPVVAQECHLGICATLPSSGAPTEADAGDGFHAVKCDCGGCRGQSSCEAHCTRLPEGAQRVCWVEEAGAEGCWYVTSDCP